MTREQVREFVTSTSGRIFAIEFVKRSTGELRLMNCRTGVVSRLRGGERAYDPESKGLVTVFDMNKNDYRSVPLDGVTRIKRRGKWEEVTG